jgi:sigma-B regulation protein RsbU (phosphoserine phosphatase)
VKDSIRSGEYRLQQIRKLTEVSRALTYAVSLDEVFQLTVDRAADLLDAEKSLLMIADDEGQLVLRSSHGVDATLAARFHEPLNEALAPRLAGLLDARPESFLGVPLVVAGAIKGLLVVIRPALSTIAEQDEWLLSALADQAAVALEKTRLDEMGEFREQLLAIVGHDLRNPLSSIMMGLRLLLQRQCLGEKETELVRRMTSSASQAGRLIDQLLDLTRSRLGGGIPIDPKRFDMHDVCRQVIDETELTHPDRPLRVHVRGDLTGVWDSDRIYQLLTNLIGNAVQHGEPRSSIDLRMDGGETELAIEVANRGEPIPAATLPVIFEAFRQGRTDNPCRTHGLGLGLFIAQQVVRSHGGSIAVTSSQSDGTIFRVRLPRDAAAATR